VRTDLSADPDTASRQRALVVGGEARVNKVGDILYLVVHHSASPLTTTFEDIERWHIEDREWKAIGYNLVVESSGMYRSGRALPRVAAARVFWPAILPVGHRDVAKPGHPTECPGLDVSTLNL
jgi:hypothetical protein